MKKKKKKKKIKSPHKDKRVKKEKDSLHEELHCTLHSHETLVT